MKPGIVGAAIAAVVLSTAGVAAAQTPELDRATALYDQADAMQEQRKFKEALELLTQSLAIREKLLGPSHADVAVSLNLIGVVHWHQNNLAEAERILVRALEVRRTAAEVEPWEISEALSNLALVYDSQGRIREAEPLLVEANTILVRARAPAARRAPVINNLARLLYRRGDFARARDEFRRAVALFVRVQGPSHPNVARVRNNLGLALQDLGSFAEAEAMFRRSLAIREKGNDAALTAVGVGNLAQVIHEQGRLDEAERLYNRALDLFRNAGQADTVSAAKVMNNLAVLHLLKKQPDLAGPLYERALALREKALGSQHPDVATALLSYAIYLLDRGRLDDAIETYARGSDINEHNIALVLEVGSEAQKQRYLQTYTDSNDVMLWLRSRGQSAVADRTALLTLLRRKGRIQEVLATSSDALRASGAPPAALEELGRVRAELARLVLEAPGSAAERDATIRRLEQRADVLEAQLSAATADIRSARAFTIEALQARIPADAALVEFFRYRPFDTTAIRVGDRFGAPQYVAVAVRRSGPPQWLELGDAAAIDRRIAGFRTALINPNRTDVAARAAQLSPLLTAPLRDLIGNAGRVLLSPDGDLNLLPFQALVDADGRFLVERYEFTYLTSGRDLLGPAPTVSPNAPLIVANPAFGTPSATGGVVSRSFKPLPGTAAEAEALRTILPAARVLEDAAATEAAVKAARGPALLHVATHGFFLTSSARDATVGTRGFQTSTASSRAVARMPPLLRSGLALAGANLRRRNAPEDGILTAAEAAMLDLRGTALVFLSSCESGLGVVNAGESVYGLRRAFVIAGTRSQVLTLWQVSDVETQAFVVAFYKDLSDGTPRSTALRNAQRQALTDARRAHPFYWAPFILSGEGGPLRVAGR